MNSRDNNLWLKFWLDQRTDFHQNNVNQLLIRFWPSFHTQPGSRVFIPLCGKSLDILWLAEQGYEVIGVELSPIAVKAFFRENHMQPSKRRMGKFTVWQQGKISILCGDYFALLPENLGVIDIVYDRAALTALPEDIRKHYVKHLRLIVPDAEQIFLLTAEDVEGTKEFSSNNEVDSEISSLYATEYNIEVAHTECVSVTDSANSELVERIEYKVYQLTSHR
ncbi:thiopurine S-methyltransferase [Methylomonas sp. AM2-LC]|uniref:thiopurine S-methyltransferase n=1 Tax=Methylomonas sp. AM2-LC TaxID=3153301 RepID=UPI003267F859